MFLVVYHYAVVMPYQFDPSEQLVVSIPSDVESQESCFLNILLAQSHLSSHNLTTIRINHSNSTSSKCSHTSFHQVLSGHHIMAQRLYYTQRALSQYSHIKSFQKSVDSFYHIQIEYITYKRVLVSACNHQTAYSMWEHYRSLTRLTLYPPSPPSKFFKFNRFFT